MNQFEPGTALASSLVYLLINLTMSSYIEVETIYGKLRGGKGIGRNGREYAEFLGIPFAQPPIGKLRFEAPVPPVSWNDIRDATLYGSACIQYEFLTHFLTGTEDCLKLNVYTNQLTVDGSKSSNKPKPVIVYFHGGIFMSGFTFVYGPKYFMEEDVVLVTAAYRLNALGFLNTGDGIVHGNMGLKDQVMALKWIQQNIKFFGGDPNLVTIMGQSAGGASAHYHLLSKMSTGLFHRAISLSGTAINPWAFQLNVKEQYTAFAKTLGCFSPNSAKTVACLKSVPAYRLVRAQKNYLSPIADPLALFAPSIETIDANDAFLATHPMTLVQNGTVSNHVPWLTGVTNGEGLIGSTYLLRSPAQLEKLETNWNTIVPKILHYDHLPNADLISKVLHAYYFGNRTASVATLENITRLYSDALFYIPFLETLTAQVKTSIAPIFTYYFTYSRDFGLANVMTRMVGRIPRYVDYGIGATRTWFESKIRPDKINRYGVCHSDELTLLFNIMSLGDEITPGSKDYRFSLAFVKLIVSFAHDGKPSNFLGVDWSPVELKEDGTLSLFELSTNPKQIPIPFQDSIDLWRNISKQVHLKDICGRTV